MDCFIPRRVREKGQHLLLSEYQRDISLAYDMESYCKDVNYLALEIDLFKISKNMSDSILIGLVFFFFLSKGSPYHIFLNGF